MRIFELILRFNRRIEESPQAGKLYHTKKVLAVKMIAGTSTPVSLRGKE